MTTTQRQQTIRLKSSEQRFILILGDLIAGVLALMAALYLWASGDEWFRFSLEFLKSRSPAWFYLLPIIWIILLVDIYDVNKASTVRMTLQGIGVAILISAVIYLAIYFAVPPSSLPRLGVALFIIFAAILTTIWRLIYIRIFRSASQLRRVLIIGAGKAGSALVEVFSEQETKPFNLIGLIDDDPAKLGTSVQGYPILGNHTELAEIIAGQDVTDLILAISNEMNHGMFQSILIAQEDGLTLTTMAETYENLTGRVPILLLESDWVIRSFLDRAPNSGFYRVFKRIMDLVFSFLGLILLVVFFPFLALIILIDSGRPIFFLQERLGRGGKPYVMYKFRSMKRETDMISESLVTAANDPRVTRVGRFMRKTHLDELPQIINVFKGEMSIVGPRSERSELVTIFQKSVPFYRTRMLVKPGITGWAQIHQAYAETIEETATKLEYDLYYIQHASIMMDITIILRTASAVLGFKGR